MVLAVFNLISDLSSATVLVYAINTGAIVRQVEAFTHVDGDPADNPVLNVLRDGLCCQIPLDKDLEDISAVLLLEDFVNSGFKLRER